MICRTFGRGAFGCGFDGLAVKAKALDIRIIVAPALAQRDERSHIGPGSSQALAISGRANVAITDSMITNAGGAYGIFLNSGALRLHKVNISNADSALVAQNDGRASLSLVLIHSVNYRARFPIFATDNVSIQVDQSVICIPANYRWESTRGNARITPSGIYGANGAALHTPPRPSDLADQARRLCADRF